MYEKHKVKSPKNRLSQKFEGSPHTQTLSFYLEKRKTEMYVP